MSFSTSCKCAVAALALTLSTPAWAFTPPRVGYQHLTLGVTNEPGLLLDDSAPDGEFSEHATVWGQRLRVGLQHAVHTNFYAAAELEAGMTFFNEHTAAADGRAPSEKAFTWQASIVGRAIPGGDEGGFHLGAGMSMLRISLEDAPLYVVGFDLRTGWIFWYGNSFAMIDLGYVAPFIQGLALPTDFSGTRQTAPQNWSLHRAFVAISVGF